MTTINYRKLSVSVKLFRSIQYKGMCCSEVTGVLSPVEGLNIVWDEN